MSVKIHKLLKSDLSLVSTIESPLDSTSGMTISHYADGTHDSSADVPFTIEGVDGLIPYIEEVEFCVAIKKSVDILALGADTASLRNAHSDKGKYADDDAHKYENKSPERPKGLPLGFKESYKRI